MKHALNHFFARVVVINLKSRPDRRAEMAEQFGRIGLGFDSPGVHLFEATKPDAAAGFSSLGARGCFLSHLAVLREALAQQVESVLILEDDLNFCDDFERRFSSLAQALRSRTWGMLYGSYLLDPPLPASAAPCHTIDASLPVATSAFVAVHGTQIAALVSYLEAMLARPCGDPLGGPMHIDGAYCWFRRSHPEVTTWLAQPALGLQRSSRTDVHALRWYDRFAWTAWAVARVRRWRNWLRR